jgi:hypothetical protein
VWYDRLSVIVKGRLAVMSDMVSDSVARYLTSLRSPNADLRKQAISALGKLADPSALPELSQAQQTDPEPDLRLLAARAIQYIQQQQANRPAAAPAQAAGLGFLSLSDEKPFYEQSNDPAPRPQGIITPLPVQPAPAPAPVLPVAPMPADFDVEPLAAASSYVNSERVGNAQGHLRQAFNFQSIGDSQNALSELALAIEANPGLTADRSVRNLASALLGNMPPKQATQKLMDMLAAGQIKRTNANLNAGQMAFRKHFQVFAITFPLLVLAMFCFVLAYSYRVRADALIAEGDLSRILPDFLRRTNASIVQKALPVTFISVFVVMFYVGGCFVLAAASGGIASFVRHLSAFSAVQVLTFLVLAVGMFFVPYARYYPDGPGQYILVINLAWSGIGFFWVVAVQGYTLAITHKLSLRTGMIMVAGGMAATVYIGNWLGFFRGSIFS